MKNGGSHQCAHAHYIITTTSIANQAQAEQMLKPSSSCLCMIEQRLQSLSSSGFTGQPRRPTHISFIHSSMYARELVQGLGFLLCSSGQTLVSKIKADASLEPEAVYSFRCQWQMRKRERESSSTLRRF